ncbi:MAG: Crp/Fnr family transcriptional regulator [gamma proteobacterium symbiont of Bathyaustriella thionipta]|nr:Crp/Fnr family transcriptional regulator [gamma proteobacterium symbiont of Bathyaustriella thionipta]MCU7951039.1 Crp/Fnr family transcriptional regulator [gamma proteobacterium symbiont of Bathyaustriella thionipta]MCU7951890.1 Crp/Fnr family transcriptional regulator [gamma proteobacterium symbiont of Bathyaustriella thionipta]MCU7957540.1 Crp/Fnr family transcriptional regulator [gamma proteobacterium symbiont of Bathyaustriella thionipta]MCU7965953.1 Crp/Fnr family transcriptional regul
MSISKLFQQELRQHYLFRRLPDEAFNNILSQSNLTSLRRNETLFEQGDEASRFFLVRSGQIMLFQTSPEGNEKVVDIIGPGQTFAEAVMFMEGKRFPVNARATGNTELFYFDNNAFTEQLHKSNTLCFAMMADMSTRLKGLLTEISELTIYNAKHRLISYLLGHINDLQEQPTVKLTATKSMIASKLSITPETFSRIMSKLKKEGLITIEDETITLIQPDKLKEIIGESFSKTKPGCM